MSDFIPQFVPQIRDKDIEAVTEQMKSGWVGCGETVKQLEEKIKQITGAKHCFATTSGTTAIMLAVKACCPIGRKRIVFPAYTFLAGANACRFLNHDVHLVDVDLETMCMRPEDVQHRLEEVVMFVNHNGYVGEDIKKIKKYMLTKTPRQSLIEDSSQCIGIPNAGRTGDIGVFSFSVPKLITGGQGGVIITDNDWLAQKLDELIDHGANEWRKSRTHKEIGGNFKFNDIQASYILSQLEDIDELLVQRKGVFDCYREHISLMDHGYESAWMVIYQTEKADEIIAALKEGGIQAVQYYKPVNHNNRFRDGQHYKNADELCRTLVYLPSSLSLTKNQIDGICSTILEIEGK